MAITRINTFQAQANSGDALKAILDDALPAMTSADGFHAYRILQDTDNPDRIVVIEHWDSIEAHRAAAASISPEALQRAMALLAGPPTGSYYTGGEPVVSD